MVLLSASAFMCATISTSPEPTSVATQVTSPFASNFGANARPSSTSSVEPRDAKGESCSVTAALYLMGGPAAPNDCLARSRSAISPAHHADEAGLLGGIVTE